MNSLRVIRAGLCTTVQDLGRPDLREYGVPRGGAMDRFAHELANRLVRNPAAAATLEMTLTGDELEWPDGGQIAVTGAEMSPVISVGSSPEVSLPMNRPVTILPGARIRFQAARRGCRCYLAVAGGIDVPLVMGSRSTYLRAHVGDSRVAHCRRAMCCQSAALRFRPSFQLSTDNCLRRHHGLCDPSICRQMSARLCEFFREATFSICRRAARRNSGRLLFMFLRSPIEWAIDCPGRVSASKTTTSYCRKALPSAPCSCRRTGHLSC